MATTTHKDFYAVLGVKRDASEDEIKRAYRRLAREHHPDRNRGSSDSEARFKSINEAYEVLSDAKSRRDFDEFGDQWKHADELRASGHRFFGNRGGQGAGHATFSSFAGGFPFADMFGFGRGRAESHQTVETDLLLEEAYSGTERTVSVASPDGSTRNIAVKIPAGIADGGKVRVSPSGMAPIEVKVKVRKHRQFQRVGDDLHTEFAVPLHVPILGGTARVRTLDGAVELTVPAGTPNGKAFKLAGKGMPKLNGTGCGNLVAKLSVTLPERISDEERQIFEHLKEIRERS